MGAAKSVIRNKLAVMYRGMRGLDAAEEAFRMCNVEVDLNIQGPTQSRPQYGKRKRPFKGKNKPNATSDADAKKPNNGDSTPKNGAGATGAEGGP